MVVSRAIVEADGRIRLPHEVAEAAHLEPGQELDITYESGVLTVTTPGAPDDWPVGEGFLAGLDEALNESRLGKTTVQSSDEEFEAELMRRAGKRLDADA